MAHALLSFQVMPNDTSFQNNGPQSPFFHLMSEADQIQIQELPEAALSQERSFLVKIKQRAPETAPVKPPKDYLSEADLLLANGDFLLARNLFSYQLKKNLRDERAMEGLGICFLKLNEILAAKKCFKALWEMHQKARHAIYLGLCYVQEQNTEAALALFAKVVSTSEIESSLRYEYFKAYGNQLMVAQKWDAAETEYIKALKEVPQSAAVLVNLGTLSLQRKRVSEATEFFKRALATDPGNSKALCGFGLVDLEKGSHETAEIYFEKALDQDSQNALALRFLVHLKMNSPNTQGLKARINTFLQQEPKHGEIRLAYATLLLQENRFSEALEQADEALKMMPQDPRILKIKKLINQNRHWGTG